MIIKNSADFKKFNASIKEMIDDNIGMVTKESLSELYSDLVERTPVDTGHAKENWHFTHNKPAEKELNIGDQSAITETNQFLESNPFLKSKTVYLTNTASNTSKKTGTKYYYMMRLEEGHSKQAPNGVVRISLARMISKWRNKSI